MDIAGPVGRAVLGIRLLPSWASRATDGIPCVVLFLAVPQPKPVPSRRLTRYKQALPFQDLPPPCTRIALFSSAIARPLNPRSRASLPFLLTRVNPSLN
jgi:hypothetical protein